jgi:cytochrome P450
MTAPPGRCPVTYFDHHSPAHAADPVLGYRRQREQSPIAWTDAHGGYWVISGWDAMAQAAGDDELFSSARHESGGDGLAILIPKSPVAPHIPIEIDPPQFQLYRRLLMQLTKPTAIKLLEPMVERYTTKFIDDVIEAGECDLASVVEVPAIVTIDWIGLDPRDYRRYSSSLFAVIACHPDSPEYRHAAEVEIPRIEHTVRTLITDRRRQPGTDVITALTQADFDGRRLTDDEIYSMAELLISGGVGTTASLVGQAVVWLARNPAERARLIENPALLEDTALEELLRVFSPTQALARTVMRDVEFHGCRLRKGDRALISWASANRDPAQFPDADRVDLERWPNRHAAFGIGVHRCAGLHLARAMSRSLIGQILGRMPDYEVDFDKLERYPDQGVNVGWKRIPTRFTPGPRRGPGLWAELAGASDPAPPANG